MATDLIPPQPIGVLPGDSYWNDWIEKVRSLVNGLATSISWSNITGIPSNVTNAQSTLQKDTANGYAGLNSVSRTTHGVTTTDDLIVASSTKGLVLLSPNGHYWLSSISNTGVVTWTDLGTTSP